MKRGALAITGRPRDNAHRRPDNLRHHAYDESAFGRR
jgi:hypothetical protein